MVPKKKRVTKDLFQSVMKTGKMLSSPLFVFRYLPTQDGPKKEIRYAVVAPKSVAKKATDRNKLRRQGYNAIRTTPIQSGIGIFFYKKQAKNIDFSQIKDEIAMLVAKSKL